MTQNELLYMLTIAEHGTITRAAQELFISQPSLSESLNKVEQEFDTRIFSRTQEGLVPTAFGAHYLKTARNILDRYRKLETDTLSKLICPPATFLISKGIRFLCHYL